MNVKRYDFDCYAFYDSARLDVQECEDGDYVLHSDYAATEEERDKLAHEVMRLVNINEQLHERHTALREAVKVLRNLECGIPEMGMLGAHKVIIEAARAEVDRLLSE